MRHIEKDYSKIPDSLSNKKFQKHFTGIKSGKFKNISGDYYAANDVKEDLKSLYNNKCAYCETKLRKPEIEHYRPTSIYRLLAYEWSNLLFSCHECNLNKREKFPVSQKYDGTETNAKKLNEYEEPILLNPEIDYPKSHFKFNISGEIQGITYRAKQTINILKLNEDTLVNQRKKIIENIFQEIKDVFFDFIESKSRNKEDLQNNLKRRIKKIPQMMQMDKIFSLTV